VPFDPQKPTITSGIRVGTPAGTTRGFGLNEFAAIGTMIVKVLDGLKQGDNKARDAEEAVKAEALALCNRFPIYASVEA
jgi:glycine hydroxymethyltransferase